MNAIKPFKYQSFRQNTQVPACSASQFYKHTGKNKPRVF